MNKLLRHINYIYIFNIGAVFQEVLLRPINYSLKSHTFIWMYIKWK